MRLVITTPASVLVDAADVRSLRAEDASGWFGIRPGHADLLTVLQPSVMSWVEGDERERFAALRGGVLTVRGGAVVELATREAFIGDDLDTLEDELNAAVAADSDSRAEARSGHLHLEAAAIRHLQHYLDAARGLDAAGGGR